MTDVIEKRDKHFIDSLFKMACDVPPAASARIAAAIVYKGSVVAYGTNSNKTHALQKRYGKNSQAICQHAEISAIINAIKRVPVEHLTKCTLYIARAKKVKPGSSEMVWGLSKPCSGCDYAITQVFKLHKVVYTTNTMGYFECL